MDSKLVINIIYNTALLLALCLAYAVVEPKNVKMTSKKGVFIGFILGLVGIAIMLNPHVLAPGIVFDARSVLIGVTAMFLGPAPVCVTAAMTIAFRVISGGGGAVPGICVIIVSAAIGLLWRRLRFEKAVEGKSGRFIELYITGVIIHAFMLASMLLLPWQDALTVLRSISLPVMLIYPVATAVLGMLLFKQVDRVNIQARLEESENRYRNLFENSKATMLLFRQDSKAIVDANSAACTYYGWTHKEILEKKMSDLDASAPEEVGAKYAEMNAEHKSHMHLQHRLKSGEVRDVEVFGGPIEERGEPLFFAVVHDITNRTLAQRKLEESEERLKVTLLSVGDGVITTDDAGTITLINSTAKGIVGCVDDAVGKPINTVLRLEHEVTGEPVGDPVRKVIETGHTVGIANHTVLISCDGTKKMIEDSAAPIKDDKGNLLGVVFVFRDVTEERKKQQQITYLSYHDSLTGLYNRGFFDEELKRLDTGRNLPVSIIVGDVNGLKLTNDAFGHDTGDQLLCGMAQEIKKACRKEDIIARWGGDEFIILLPRTNEKSAERVCERIKSNCAKVKMADVNFSISLGHETKASPEQPIEEVLKSAEQYMYRKKYLESSSLRGKTINTILTALHEKNPREQQHSQKVSEYCVGLAKAIGMSTREVNQMELIGIMHDIGKIAISDRVLNKKGALTAKEWSELKRHPEIGYRILSSSNDMAYIADYVLKHHERPDGQGYPNGISGGDIPLESRMVAVADAYAAMTNERVFRDGIPEQNAVEELRAKAGTQFDAEIVEIFINDVLKANQTAELAGYKQ